LENEQDRPQTDLALVEAIKSGDESAFQKLVERYYSSMVRIAALYVRDSAVAEDVTQETWIAVLKGLDKFEGRSSFKTWLFTILTNRAKTRAGREERPAPVGKTAMFRWGQAGKPKTRPGSLTPFQPSAS